MQFPENHIGIEAGRSTGPTEAGAVVIGDVLRAGTEGAVGATEVSQVEAVLMPVDL